ncbi:signal peptidase I [Methanocella sp. CWC-04]|uniref:Signal peptidase I n=1 Tax=Methanooceanicella nereidis TaxID=2052831 RepID=A0AAP2W7A9_9EURY|nr:signal peptidase I [Methanocella sp. CWC-04]MCD1294896.1 signal peptidase I [Methanocella sp. CWC-04]
MVRGRVDLGVPVNNLVYVGKSMYPTLKDLDMLCVIPYINRGIRCGDVVAFFTPDEGKKVAHRIISITDEGIKTRGDNNAYVDKWVLRPNNLIGQVVFVERGSKLVKISGGLRGGLSYLWHRFIKFSKAYVFYVVYRINGIWPALLKKDMAGQKDMYVLHFKRPEGMEMQLFMGKKLVGKRLPGAESWRIFRPYDLFIDEEYLDRHNSLKGSFMSSVCYGDNAVQ